MDDSGHVVAEPCREHDNPAYMYFQHYVSFPQTAIYLRSHPVYKILKTRRKCSNHKRKAENVPCMILSFSYDRNQSFNNSMLRFEEFSILHSISERSVWLTKKEK